MPTFIAFDSDRYRDWGEQRPGVVEQVAPLAVAVIVRDADALEARMHRRSAVRARHADHLDRPRVRPRPAGDVTSTRTHVGLPPQRLAHRRRIAGRSARGLAFE